MKKLFSKTDKSTGLPKFENPPLPPERQETETPVTKSVEPDTAFSRKKSAWTFKQFDSPGEACAFINGDDIEPRFIYPTSTGRVTVWYLQFKNAAS
jgi:hypothetical protein